MDELIICKMNEHTDLRVRSNREMRYDLSASRSPASRNFNATSSKVTEHCAKHCAAWK